MKVSGASGAQATGVSGAARRPAATAEGFAPLGGASGASATSASGGVAAVAGLDALLMLQEPEDSLTRRRRAVRRADGLLDRLDALKLSLMGEGDPQAALERLAQAMRERRSEIDAEPGLHDVLDAVETRAAVELAKLEIGGAVKNLRGSDNSPRA